MSGHEKNYRLSGEEARLFSPLIQNHRDLKDCQMAALRSSAELATQSDYVRRIQTALYALCALVGILGVLCACLIIWGL